MIHLLINRRKITKMDFLLFIPTVVVNYHKNKMNKIISNFSKNNLKHFLSASQFYSKKNSPSTLVIEIGKEPTSILNNSLWVGYRNGGMASWLSSLLPHLPCNQFVLYMDQDSYEGSEYMYSYYSEYFSKLFHREYAGTFIQSRKLFSPKDLSRLNEIKAQQIQNQLLKVQQQPVTKVLLDLRNSDAASKDNITNILKNYKNAKYINLPLNDEDLLETLSSRTENLPRKTKFITMCAKGYRSLIGYSMLNIIKKKDWQIQLCRNQLSLIKQELSKDFRLGINQAKVSL